ncbi:MAG: phage minor head protein [Gemmatimonadota bacterium]
MTGLREFDTSTPDPEERQFPPGTVNGKLLEAVLRHRHYLLRVENGVIKNLLGAFREAQVEILGQIARIAAAEDALTDFGLLRLARLREMESRIQSALQGALGETLRRSSEDFLDVAMREVEIQNAFLRKHIPDGISLDLIGPDADRLAGIINQPLGGIRWGDRMRRNYGEMALEMRRSLGASVTLGEGIGPAVTRLRNVAGKLGTQRLRLIARSEIQRVANDTAIETYQRNGDVLKGIQIFETLDDRACLICAAQDGKVLPINTPRSSLPPFHAGCRGYSAPIVRSFEEMGLDPLTFPPSTRASMDGQVAASVDYEQWFGAQSEGFQRRILGPSRFQLFQSGELKVTEFARDNRILRIGDLPTMSLSMN